MIASAVAPVSFHHSASVPANPPAATRPSRLRGLSLLRRSGQNKSNPNSPPVSPPERTALERSTSYPLNANLIAGDSSSSNTNVDRVSNGSSTQSNDLTSPTDATHPASAATVADLPNTSIGSTLTAAISSPITATFATPSSSKPSRGLLSSSNLASESSSGMARLRRAFSSQTGSQPAANVANSSTSMAPAPPSASSAALASPPANGSQKTEGPAVSNGNNNNNNTATTPAAAATATTTRLTDANATGRDGLAPDQMPTIKFIPHQDPRSARPSLAFAATSRTLPHEDCVIRVGRYSERDGPQNPPPGVPSAAPVGFKSKVVSRKHCEFWCSQGQWYVKDIKSSSGTFLNHIRLSQPNQESRPFPINDGDVVQLGIDFKGGEEAIFRCVKIRIECNRNWQKKLNDFNMNTHKRLRELNKTVTAGKDASGQTNECSICLMSIAPCQSLFVAPCSHVWHFKCIRPMLNDHKTYPQFLCPNCRAVTDLEADIEEIEWNQEVDEQQDTDPEGLATASATEESPVASEHPATATATTAAVIATAAAAAVVTTTAATAAADDEEDSAEQRDGLAELPSSQPASDSGLAAAVSSLELADTSVDPVLHSETAPVEVPGSSANEARPSTPPEDISELNGIEGPLTPRNDAGPFVFDGGAGGARTGRNETAGESEGSGGRSCSRSRRRRPMSMMTIGNLAQSLEEADLAELNRQPRSRPAS